MTQEDIRRPPHETGYLKSKVGKLKAPLDHSLKRKKICDVCSLELIGGPMQKRHKHCANIVKKEKQTKRYNKWLTKAPGIDIPSTWIFKEIPVEGMRATFESVSLDGMFVVGILRCGGNLKGRKKRISRARLIEGWERVNAVSN